MKRMLIAAALAAVATVAQAQPAPGGPGGQPRDLDLDHDGRVTLAEFKKVAGGGFLGRMDANKDGKITKAEVEAFQKQMQQFRAQNGAPPAPPPGARPGGPPRFDIMAQNDTNKDGVISRAEMDAAEARRFDMADTNHDGWLSKGEVLKMRQNRARGG